MLSSLSLVEHQMRGAQRTRQIDKEMSAHFVLAYTSTNCDIKSEGSVLTSSGHHRDSDPALLLGPSLPFLLYSPLVSPIASNCYCAL